MKGLLKRLGAFTKRYERHLSTAFFVAGFVGDIIAFTLLDVTVVSALFAAYIILGALAILGSHYLFSNQEALPKARNFLTLGLPLFVQYILGSTLSGALIFYTKSSVLTVSWPFILLLATVFFGNEIFRNYRDHLAFQTTLFFFGFYIYLIFELPLLIKHLGLWVFALTSAIAIGTFLIFLFTLYKVGEKRFKESVKKIALSSVGIVVLVSSAYVTGLIPPIPLALKEGAIFHHVTKIAGGYEIADEASRPWWEFWDDTVHVSPGESLYAYSAVYAPISFDTTIVHRWEYYDTQKEAWVERSRLAFMVSGGRTQGYRGYSIRQNPEAGKWRVYIETPGGQVLGKLSFDVVRVNAPVLLHTEYR
ncbi:MAG: DUF2914 domain-containing protein [Candidatus Pacebacteria bacterium]|nr:DUF2914 domain-containing protein [Candidatus Paceibacterota bacterium]